jgi:rhodanese-related sulfurtransferase
VTHSIQTISASEFCSHLQNHPDTLVIDVRSPAELRTQRLAQAVNLPLDCLNAEKVNATLQDKRQLDTARLFILCQSGKRAQLAAQKLADSTDYALTIITGGVNALANADVPLLADTNSGNVISLERQVRIAAGSLVLAGVLGGALLNPVIYFMPAAIGAGLIYAGISDTCGMALLLARMPWNR